MDIGRLGKVLVEQLVDHRLVQDLADIFRLHEERTSMIALVRMAEKSVDNVLAAVEGARTSRSMTRLLTGLGIPLVGATVAALITEKYSDIDMLLEADSHTLRDDLAAIHGVGPKIAESVADYFADEYHRAVLVKMQELGLRTVAIQKVAKVTDGPLSGSSFCVTGTLSEPRPKIHALIEAAGGEIHKSVKKGTSYLVAGENVGKSKTDKAAKVGCTVLDEATLRAMLP